MPLFWFVSFVNGIKRIRDKTFCFDVQFKPKFVCPKSCVGFVCPKSQLCTTLESCVVQLWRVAWDLNVRSPNFVARETSNDRFIILAPVLPLARKWRVTHYPRVTKKKKENKKKVLLRANPTNNKRIRLCGVHLGLLPQTSSGDSLILYSSLLSLPILVRLLPRVDLSLFLYLYLYLFLLCLYFQFRGYVHE